VHAFRGLACEYALAALFSKIGRAMTSPEAHYTRRAVAIRGACPGLRWEKHLIVRTPREMGTVRETFGRVTPESW